LASIAHIVLVNHLLPSLVSTLLAQRPRFNIELGVATLHFAQSIVEVIRLVERSSWVHHVLRVALVEELSVVKLAVVDVLDLCVVEPFNALPVLPKAILQLVVFRHYVSTDTMLLAPVPVAFVTAAISPGVDSEAVLLIVFVLALVNTAIVPNIDANALHVVFEPLTLITSTV